MTESLRFLLKITASILKSKIIVKFLAYIHHLGKKRWILTWQFYLPRVSSQWFYWNWGHLDNKNQSDGSTKAIDSSQSNVWYKAINLNLFFVMLAQLHKINSTPVVSASVVCPPCSSWEKPSLSLSQEVSFQSWSFLSGLSMHWNNIVKNSNNFFLHHTFKALTRRITRKNKRWLFASELPLGGRTEDILNKEFRYTFIPSVNLTFQFSCLKFAFSTLH